MKFTVQPGIDYVGITTSFYCHDGKGNFLLSKRSTKCRDEHSTWEMGGGKLEFGLSLEENVRKEILEEYSCHSTIQEALPPLSDTRKWDGKQTHWINFPFFVLVNPAEVKIGEPEYMTELGWFRLDNLPSPLHTGFAHAFKTYRSHFNKYQ